MKVAGWLLCAMCVLCCASFAPGYAGWQGVAADARLDAQRYRTALLGWERCEPPEGFRVVIVRENGRATCTMQRVSAGCDLFRKSGR